MPPILEPAAWLFTSEGFELVWVVVVAMRGHVLLDEYVRLQAHIFDSNIQFLGSTVQHMAAAVSFCESTERL